MRLPLAHRELARLGRSRRVYAWRALLIGSAALALVVMWADAALHRSPERIGESLYTWCILAQAAILFVVLPALAAPTIASERHEHMLPLLLIADFRGWDILAAKALAVLVEAGLLLLALAPIQFMCTAFGGVSPAVIAAQTGVVAALVVFAVMVSMLCSCFVRNPAGATFAAVALVAGSLIALYILDRVFLDDGMQFENLRSLFFEVGSRPRPCRRAIAVVLLLAAMGACAIVWLLPRIAGDPPRRYWVGAPTPYGHTSRRLLRWGPVLPILSVHATGLTSTLRSNGVRVAVAALLALVGSAPVIGPFLVVMLLVQEVALSLGNAKRSGAIDDLRVTLLDSKMLSADILRFYMRRGILYAPALMIAALQIVIFAENVRFEPNATQTNPMDSQVYALLYVGSIAAGVVGLGFLQVFAIVCVSCMSALSGLDVRRQVGVAIVILGMAYALCLTGVQCQAELITNLKIGDAWFSVPLALAACIAVFLTLGLSCRSELRRVMEGETIRRSAGPALFQRARAIWHA